jgi:hypothetical protein
MKGESMTGIRTDRTRREMRGEKMSLYIPGEVVSSMDC